MEVARETVLGDVGVILRQVVRRLPEKNFSNMKSRCTELLNFLETKGCITKDNMQTPYPTSEREWTEVERIIQQCMPQTYFDQMAYCTDSVNAIGAELCFPLEEMTGRKDRESMCAMEVGNWYHILKISDTATGPSCDMIVPAPQDVGQLLPESYAQSEFKRAQEIIRRLPPKVTRVHIPPAILECMNRYEPLWLPKLSYFGRIERGPDFIGVAVYDSQRAHFHALVEREISYAKPRVLSRKIEMEFAGQTEVRLLIGRGYRIERELRNEETTQLLMNYSTASRRKYPRRWLEDSGLSNVASVPPNFSVPTLAKLFDWIQAVYGKAVYEKCWRQQEHHGDESGNDRASAQVLATYLYSLEGVGAYTTVNNALRSENRQNIIQHLPFIEALLDACLHPATHRLTSNQIFQGAIVYRGTALEMNIADTYVEGKEGYWSAFTSTSLSKPVSDDFVHNRVQQSRMTLQGVMFVITLLSIGAALEKVSSERHEAEVLIPPTYYTITRVTSYPLNGINVKCVEMQVKFSPLKDPWDLKIAQPLVETVSEALTVMYALRPDQHFCRLLDDHGAQDL
eukprot:PhF_6_TR40338/c1_g1_i2/m.59988